MSVKLLTEHNLEFLRFKRGYTGSSESTLVKMPHCWKSHVTAHILDFSCTVVGRLVKSDIRACFVKWTSSIFVIG